MSLGVIKNCERQFLNLFKNYCGHNQQKYVYLKINY